MSTKEVGSMERNRAKEFITLATQIFTMVISRAEQEKGSASTNGTIPVITRVNGRMIR